MKKIFRIFSVLVVFAAVMGLTSCGDPDPVSMNISSESMLRTFMSNGSTTGVLTDDISITAPIQVSKTKILNLNGKSITYTGTATQKGCIEINGGTLNIIDNSTTVIANSGCIINDSTADDNYAVVVWSGNLEISKGQFKSKRSGIYVAGTATITNCKIVGDYDQNTTATDADSGVLVARTGTITNINCDVDGGKFAIFNRGQITAIGGGNYAAYASIDGTPQKPMACIYNANNSDLTGTNTAASIGNITAATITSQNSGTSTSTYGIYKEDNSTVGNLSIGEWSIQVDDDPVNTQKNW